MQTREYRIHKEEMGKGNKGEDLTGELGENMSTSMVLDWVKYMAGVLLEKYNKILYHIHTKTTPGQRRRLLEALWI